MPIRIPSGLYARGATFDTTPFTNVVLKDIAAKEVAKKAIAKSADDLYKGLNPAGVRPQDLQYPQDNTKGILPDMVNWYNNAKAGSIDFGKYKEMLYNIERSKQIAKEQLEIGGMVQQGKIELDEKYGDVTKLSQKDLSIYDAGHHDWKQGDLSPFISELDETKWNNSIFGSAKPQERVDKKTFDASTGRYFIPKEFTTAEEKRFGDTAASLVINDKSANKQFTKQTKNPTFLADAIPVYKEVYGVDYSKKPEEFTASQAAAAAAILEARKRKDVVSYEKAKVDNWKQKLDYQAYLRRKGATDAQGIVNTFIEDRFNEGKNKYQSGYSLAVSNKNKLYRGYEINLPLEIRNKYTIDKGFATEKIPDSFVMTTDKKKVIPIFYARGENGKILKNKSGDDIIDSNINSNPVDIDIFKVDLGQVLVNKSNVGEEAIYADEEGYQPGNTGSSTKQVKVKKSLKYD